MARPPGGAPANVACGMARLGTPMTFLGCLGREPVRDAFTWGVLLRLCAEPQLLTVMANALAITAVHRSAAACGELVCQGAGAIDPQSDPGQLQAVFAGQP